MFKLGSYILRAANSNRSHASCSYLRFHSTASLQNPEDYSKTVELPAVCPDTSKEKNISGVLEAAKKSPKLDNALRALEIFANWKDTYDIKYDEIEKSPNFEYMFDPIMKQAHNRHIAEIIMAIQNLRKLEARPSCLLIDALMQGVHKFVNKTIKLNALPFDQSLNNDLLWNVKKISLPDLFKVLSFLNSEPESPTVEKVQEATVENIERRWINIRQPWEIRWSYESHTSFSRAFISHVDERTMDLAEDFTLIDLSRIFCAIAASGRRPTPILLKIAVCMFKSNETLPSKQLVNTVYAAHSMNFPDRALLDKISQDLLVDSNNFDKSQGPLLVAMGKMRWKDANLLEAICQHVEKRVSTCTMKELCSLVITLANVDYMPSNLDSLVEALRSRQEELLLMEQVVVVDVVWALAVLGKADNSLVAHVLNEDFCNIKEYLTDPRRVGFVIKILNLNALADNLEAYHGPRLHNINSEQLMFTQNRKNLSLVKYGKQVLDNFIPPPKYARSSVDTIMGFTVDAEVILAKDGKPLRIDDYSTDFGAKESVKPLPVGARRIAMMIWHFKDYTVGTQDLTGANRLTVEILQNKGYCVAQIPFYEINTKAKLQSSVQYFERRLKETKYKLAAH